ncbi:MAG: ABC transporter permease [Candidatus Omnitrophica bacterium]|nr:ABC transporter permease [Candidatus Omnitrophota bacterium]
MIELQIARRYLFRGKAKHISFIGIISCLGIVLGVATVIVAIAIVNGIDGGLMERIMRFKPHLIIESSNHDDLYKIKEKIKQKDAVTGASLSLQTQVFAKFNGTIVPLIVKGMDLSEKSEMDFFFQYVRSQFGEEGFFVGQGVKRRYGVEDKLEFYPLQKKLKLHEEKVRGVFSVGLYDIDNYYIIADLERAKEFSPNYHFSLEVRVVDPFAVAALKEEIESEFKGIFVSTWIESNQALFATLSLEKLAMFIILGLIVLVASFNVFAMLTVKVVEKTKDIGILKSIGFTNRRILIVFTLQGVILGFIGVVAGSCLGLGICFILKRYPFIKLPQEIFFTEYLPIAVNYFEVVLISIIGMVICFISSLFPAIRASRMSACEALRYG